MRRTIACRAIASYLRGGNYLGVLLGRLEATQQRGPRCRCSITVTRTRIHRDKLR